MDQSLEASADVATGILVAGAVEGAVGAGTASDHPTCLNCGAALGGAYCSACGQKAAVHRSLGAFWHDFTHSIFHFEGKIWRTLPLLAIKPGELTRRYVHGQRARFVSPLALFLFSVFLMFATFNQLGQPFGTKSQTTRNGVTLMREDIVIEMAESQARLVGLKKQRAAAVAAKQDVAAIDQQIEEEQADYAGLKAGFDAAEGFDVGDLIKIDPEDRAGPAKRTDPDGLNSFNKYEANEWSKAFIQKIEASLKNPSLLIYKLQSNAYKFSWLLIPLSLPFLWLIFAWKRQYMIYDHLIFITYSLSFITLLLSAMAALSLVEGLRFLRTPILLIVPPAHMFAQLKGAYALSNGGALWRTLFMLSAAAFVLIIFSLILLALGVAG